MDNILHTERKTIKYDDKIYRCSNESNKMPNYVDCQLEFAKCRLQTRKGGVILSSTHRQGPGNIKHR